jgi:RHS repeat-associated protein
MLVPNRHGSSTAYRYGFNGKENDNEIMGEGNFQDYGMRMYNPRIGRFFNPDPIIVKDHKYPELSTYQFASNTPIQAVDLDGLEGTIYINLVKEPTGFNKVAYAAELRQRLIDNGAHPKTEVKYVQDLTIMETLGRFLGQGDQDIEVQIRNYSKLNNDPIEAGGYSNKKIKGIVTVYNGLTTDLDPSKSEVPVDLYVNATLHEIGHNLFNFNHDANGNTPDGEGLMDYDHAYDRGAEFNTSQKKSVYNKIGFGNKDNPLPQTKKEKETQKKQLNEINEKPKQTNEKPKKVKA